MPQAQNSLSVQENSQNFPIPKNFGKNIQRFQHNNQTELHSAEDAPFIQIWFNKYFEENTKDVKSKSTQYGERLALDQFIVFYESYLHNVDIRLWTKQISKRYIEFLEKTGSFTITRKTLNGLEKEGMPRELLTLLKTLEDKKFPREDRFFQALINLLGKTDFDLYQSLILRHAHQSGRLPATIEYKFLVIKQAVKWIDSKTNFFKESGLPTKGVKIPAQAPRKAKSLNNWQKKRVLDTTQSLIVQAYQDEEFVKINADNGNMKARRPMRDHAMIMVFMNGGIRREEVCNLNLDQFQGKHFRNIKCKGNKYRDLLLQKPVIEALQQYIEVERVRDEEFFDSNALFLPSSSRMHKNKTGRLEVSSINYIVKRISVHANIGLHHEKQFYIHPHMLRHTHIYDLLKDNANPTYIMTRGGWSSLRSMEIYTTMQEEDEEELLNQTVNT